eukprot:1160315-Pelagomonas_calceolata.AAC.2
MHLHTSLRYAYGVPSIHAHAQVILAMMTTWPLALIKLLHNKKTQERGHADNKDADNMFLYKRTRGHAASSKQGALLRIKPTLYGHPLTHASNQTYALASFGITAIFYELICI